MCVGPSPLGISPQIPLATLLADWAYDTCIQWSQHFCRMGMWNQFGHTFGHASVTLLDCRVHEHKQLGYAEKALRQLDGRESHRWDRHQEQACCCPLDIWANIVKFIPSLYGPVSFWLQLSEYSETPSVSPWNFSQFSIPFKTTEVHTRDHRGWGYERTENQVPCIKEKSPNCFKKHNHSRGQ